MKMYMIAGIYSGELRIGFRILDSDACKTMDAPDTAIISAIKSGNKIINLELDNSGKLKGSNGDIQRYAKIRNNNLIEAKKAPLVILNQIEDTGYTVCDHTGKILRLKNEDVINYAVSFGIANGKVSNKNGVQFISAISGTYDTIVDTERVKQSTTQTVNEAPIKKDVEQKEVKDAKNEDSNTGNKLPLSDVQLGVLKDYYSWVEIDRQKANEELNYIVESISDIHATSNNIKLLYEILTKLCTTSNIARVFGVEIGAKLVTFIQVGLPLPESLVIRAVREMGNNVKETYNILFPEFSDAISFIFSDRKDTFSCAAQLYLYYIVQRESLGSFKGRDTDTDYNIKKDLRKFALCSAYSFEELRALIGTVDLIKELEFDIGNNFKNRFGAKRLNRIGEMSHLYAREQSVNEQERKAVMDAVAINKCYFLDRLENNRYIWYRTESNDIIGGVQCNLNSTPKTSTDIVSAYKNQLYALTKDHTTVAASFVNFCIKTLQGEDDERRNRDREEMLKRANQINSNQHNITDDPSITGTAKVEPVESSQINNDELKTNKNTDDLPLRQTYTAGQKTKLQEDLDNGADISEYDRVEIYNELKSRVGTDTSDICFTIAEDMLKRNLKYRDMSSRQKYRFDEAINKMLKKIGTTKGLSVQKKSYDEGSVNKTYQLEDRQDILDAVNKLVSRSDSVEMQAVLKEEPNALNICYSILRNKKASDKQLLHVNRAIEILDNQ